MVIKSHLVKIGQTLFCLLNSLLNKTGIRNNSLTDSLEFSMSKLACHVKSIIVKDFLPQF